MNPPRYICPRCGVCIGYLGWAFTALCLPVLRHVCEGRK